MRIPLSQSMLNALAIVATVLAVSAGGYRIASIVKNRPAPLISTRDDWKELATGAAIGDNSATVKLIVFSDFQCPFCKVFADSARALLLRYPRDVQLVFRHRPIPEIHAQATTLAQLAICSDRVGKFEVMHDQLFAKQDSLNTLSWQSLAQSVGISDTTSVGLCMRSDVTSNLLKKDRKSADEVGLTGTPVVLVNETMVRGIPPGGMLDSLVRRALKSSQ